MSVTGIILAAVIVGGTGLFIGVFLGVAGKKFAVEVDEREEAILGVLPGNNCGGCGYAGCSGLAAAIVKGEAEVGGCPVGGAPVAAKVGEIMGVAAGAQVHEVAFVKCGGDCEKAKQEYEYHGLSDCTMVNMMQDGGPKACSYGCLGDGSCVQACPFDAIHIVNGVAVVDKEACKACGKCVAVCPKHLIEIVPYDQKHLVKCNSQDKGKAVMQACTAGCIGCKMCEKACKFEAVTVENNIAHIDYEKCKDCGACAVKCPDIQIYYPVNPLIRLLPALVLPSLPALLPVLLLIHRNCRPRQRLPAYFLHPSVILLCLTYFCVYLIISGLRTQHP